MTLATSPTKPLPRQQPSKVTMARFIVQQWNDLPSLPPESDGRVQRMVREQSCKKLGKTYDTLKARQRGAQS